jgi:hypothetical protein
MQPAVQPIRGKGTGDANDEFAVFIGQKMSTSEPGIVRRAGQLEFQVRFGILPYLFR